MTGCYITGKSHEQMNYANPQQVIFIDDEPMNNFISRSLMKKYYPGTAVQCCLSGSEALGFLEKARTDNRRLPEYIFLDLNMPVMDGWDFIKEYIERDFPLKNSSRIIILSSSVFKKDMERASAFLVVADFISKPVSFEHLQKIFHP